MATIMEVGIFRASGRDWGKIGRDSISKHYKKGSHSLGSTGWLIHGKAIVKELNLSYYIGETVVFTIYILYVYTHYGNLT